MPRYIDADKLVIETQSLEDIGQGIMEFYSKEQIEDAPTADVQPVNHGEWEKVTLALYNCSECGNEICSSEYGLGKYYKYCSKCGAKMNVKEKEKNEDQN